MYEHYFPGWDCGDDVLDATKEIARTMAGGILRDFRAGDGPLDLQEAIETILIKLVESNVKAALELASQGLRDRLESSPDGRINIRDAIRIVQELDVLSEEDQ